jgi:hypothetical protein
MDDLTARQHLLTTHLAVAVPAEIEHLRGADPAALRAVAAEAAQQLAEHGDALMFGGPHCAPTMAALTRGLAAAALTAWGGITVLGQHWCDRPTCSDPDAHHDQPIHPDRARLAPPDRRRVSTVTTGGLL